MKRSRLFLLIAVFAVFLLTNAVSAALDLGVDEITLDPGGFYEFTMPEGIVHWFVSDESIIELGGDEGTIGVSALQPGTAVVFAMSDDSGETDSCVVTVTGEAKAVKSGDLYYQDLTAEDLAKVNDPAIASVLSMAANTEAFPMGIGDLSGYEYKVLVMVKDGSQQKIADAAEAMGLADVWAYKYVSMAALRGSANDIAKLLIDYRDDIVSIETDQKYAVEPIEDDLESKDVSKLQGNAETLTDIKAAHALGYTGKDQYIAILDTGIKADHEQFIDEKGDSRVDYQACYSSEEGSIGRTTVKWGTWDVTVYEMQYPVCEGGTTESLNSAAPSGAHYPSAFNHGTHVAAIAAGKDGVAPDAGIIAYQVFTEFVYYDYNIEKEEMVDPPRRVTSKSMVYDSDANKALEALLDLISTEDISVAAVNMSYGGLLDPEEYDPDTYSYESDTYLSQLLDKGAIPCASTMNDGLDETIGDTAMSQYTFAVGALDNAAVPAVASYSNHSDQVDILAPGTQIYSAIYTDGYSDDTVTEGVNAYSKMNGTSMATPMVSGAFALLKQLNSEMGSEMNAEELKDQLLGMTDKTASRAGVEKPVLNFAGFYAYTVDEPMLDTEYTVDSSNRTIKVNTLAPGEEDSSLDGYKVELYKSGGTTPVQTQYAAADKDRTLTFSNLTNDTLYSVKVYKYIEVSKTKYYSTASEAFAVPMAVPSGFKLTTASADSVKVEWPKNETNQISVEYSTDQNGTYTTVCDKGTTPCTVAGLEADQTYYFRFRRYNVDLEYYSPYSAVSTYRIPSEPISGTHYEVGNGNKTITVKLKKNDNYDGYKVDIYLGEKLKASKTQSVPKNDATINFSGLVNDTVYTVKVTGYKTVNKVNYFSEYTIVKMAPMAVPTGLTYTANEGDTVTAEWPNNTGKQIQVEYKVENGEYEKYCEDTDSNTCTDKPLEKDTVYYFRSRWLNTTCNVYSPWSAEVSKMLLSTPQTEDSTIGYKKIRVHFNDVDTLTGHQIKVYTVNPEKLVRTVNVKYTSNKDFADITGLNNGTEYRFEISAYRTVGKTTYYSESAEVKAAPQLKPIDTDAPKEVKTSGGAKKITVSWEKDTWTTGHYIELYRMDNKVMAANAYAANNATSYTFSGGNIEYDVPYMVRVWKYNEKSPKAVGNKYVDTYAVSLATPGSFNAVTADGSITISWTYSGSADKVVAYYSSTSNKGPFDKTVDCSLEGGTNTCTIPNLTNSTLYYVKAAAAREYNGLTFTSVETAVKSAVPLPVLQNATVTTESKTVTVQYTKDSSVDGHIIQLYKLDNKGKASVVKTVTSDNSKVDGDNVTIEFSKLANGTTYYVTICSYDKIGKTTYRGAIYTSGEVKPTDTSSGASKNVVIMTEMTEPFDGFVDPVEELNAESEAEAAVETEVKEEEEQTSVFDLFRL